MNRVWIASLSFSVGTFVGAAGHWAAVKHYVLAITASHESCTVALERNQRDMERVWQAIDSPFSGSVHYWRPKPLRSGKRS